MTEKKLWLGVLLIVILLLVGRVLLVSHRSTLPSSPLQESFSSPNSSSSISPKVILPAPQFRTAERPSPPKEDGFEAGGFMLAD